MYFDNKPCRVCGSAIELRAHETTGGDGDSESEPDGTVDERICTNPDCASHAADAPDLQP